MSKNAIKWVTRPARPLTFPKISPQDAAADYIVSKQIKTVATPTTFYERASEGMKLARLESEQQLENSTHTLALQRKQIIDHRTLLDNEWAKLRQSEAMLKQNFLKFNHFVKENLEKRERSQARLDFFVDLCEHRDADIADLKELIAYYQLVKTEMDTRINSHKMYEEFLLQVVKAGAHHFRNIADVIYRYESLLDTKKQIVAAQSRLEKKLHEKTLEIAEFIKSHALEVMGCINEIGLLQMRYKRAKVKSLKWETIVSDIFEGIVSKMMEMQQVKQSCWYIYLHMCNRKNLKPEAEEGDFAAQLCFIRKTLQDLNTVMKIVHPH